VLGCAGSGKTSFARRLAERDGLPFICLDEIWQSSWTDADVPRFRSLITDAHLADAWISDGNFAAATFDIRLPRAGLIVWLERPRLVCSLRAVGRVFQPGEAHKLRNVSKVIRFIWNFDRVNRPLIERSRTEHGPQVPVLHLSTNREIEAFMAGFSGDGTAR
jgi:adenylate kinase family enzyme